MIRRSFLHFVPAGSRPALRSALVVCTLALVACSDGGGTDAALGGGLQVRLTDAPSDYVSEAHIWVSRVYLQADDDGEEAGDDAPDDGGRFDLFNDPDAPRRFDLMELRDGVEAELAEADAVPEGAWAQLRLVVDSAVVVLADGYVFESGGVEDVLFVPSGAQSGIKVQLTAPVEPDAGETVIVLVDVDVDRNFRLTGPPPETNGGMVRAMRFTPVLQEIRRREVTAG